MSNHELLTPRLPQLAHLCQWFNMSEDDLIALALKNGHFERRFLDALPLQEERAAWRGDAGVFFLYVTGKADHLYLLVKNGFECVERAQAWTKYESGAEIVEDFDLKAGYVPGLTEAITSVFDKILRAEDRAAEAKRQVEILRQQSATFS